MNYYFIGIKGSGMSALASILKDLGENVQGSDVTKVFFTDEKLAQKGIKVGSFDDQIPANTDIVILGNAFSDEHKQAIQAKKDNIEIVRYFDFVNRFATDKISVAVSGTNGKTTTTALLATLFDNNVNYLIGDGNGNGHAQSKNFIFEACEYKGTFLNYYPNIAIINNIEMDHPDFFKDVDDVIELFHKFTNNAKELIVNYDDENIRKLITKINDEKKVNTFSTKNDEADLFIKRKSANSEGYILDIVYKEQEFNDVILPFYGEHMLENSMAAILCGLVLEKEFDEIIKALVNFKGATRRFDEQVIDKEKNVILIDDYAHHPTSIELLIKSVRQKYPTSQINVIFQPHTYSRTIEFLSEFAKSLVLSDKLFLDEIFGSIREQNSEITIDVLKDEVNKINATKLVHDINELVQIEKENQIYCIIGAGDVDKKYIPKIKKMYQEKA